MRILVFFLVTLTPFHLLLAKISLGVDVFFEENYPEQLRGKKIGLITNHTGVNKDCVLTSDLFKKQPFVLKALFCPEHGLKGNAYAFEKIEHSKDQHDTPIYSLHGETRRPTEAMLKDIDILVYDMQDVGVRAYTYASTLFYAMEEAAKRNIEVMVLDRPNPMGGVIVDGPMLEESFRSFYRICQCALLSWNDNR